jgi:DNA-directed RNA polymerase subunit H (RpoH/RPB5)
MKNIKETDPVMKNIKATDPVMNNIKAPDPVMNNIKATDPVMKNIKATDTVMKNIKATDPVMNNIKATDPVMTTISKIKSRQLADKFRTVFLDLLQTFIRIADELKLVWFVDGGMLIGSWRHHGFVPWDDDIDVVVNNSQKGALLEKLKTLKPEYSSIRGDPIVKFYSNRSTVKINSAAHSWPFLDIFFFEENSDVIWNNFGYIKHIKYNKSDVFPLHKRPFENVMVNVPKRTPKILKPQVSDPSECATGNYNHVLEKGFREMIRVSCEALQDIYPFVHRKYVNNSMMETLKIGNKVIHTKLVKEPEENLTPPFSIESVK